MGLVVQFGHILDRQYVTCCGNGARAPAGSGDDFCRAHFVIGQPATKLNFPGARSSQFSQADALLGEHALKQNCTVFLNARRQNRP
jgi:hypothetical protein